MNQGWKHRSGFLLAAAGSAIGLGNLWKFPFIVGQSGGGAFLGFYLLCVLLVGWPALYAAVSLGHRSRQCAWATLEEFPQGVWIARISFLACNLVPAFYSVVGGWILGVFWEWLSMLPKVPLHPTKTQILISKSWFYCSNWQFCFLLLSSLLVLCGVQKGIERGNRIMMPILFVLLTSLLTYSLTLSGANKAIAFLFSCDFSKLTPKAMMDGLGHSFFTLSVGCGSMITFGSYLPKEAKIAKSCASVVVMDTVIAVMASLLIFCCVFSFEGQVQAGPTLLFQTLPKLFSSMTHGSFIGTCFFLLVSLTAITSMISLLEVLVANWMYRKKCSREKAMLISLGWVTPLAIISNFSWNVFWNVKIFSKPIFHFLDFITASYLMPISGISFILFYGWHVAPPGLIRWLCRIITPGLLVLSLTASWLLS
ncbi:MAG: sodium-dependent transporter [Oligoflexales bacterium]